MSPLRLGALFSFHPPTPGAELREQGLQAEESVGSRAARDRAGRFLLNTERHRGDSHMAVSNTTRLTESQ